MKIFSYYLDEDTKELKIFLGEYLHITFQDVKNDNEAEDLMNGVQAEWREEQNKMLALFMGGVETHGGAMIAFPDISIEGEGTISNNRAVADLHYHTSWDWLVPVLQKAFHKLDHEVSFEEFAEFQSNNPMVNPVRDTIGECYLYTVNAVEFINKVGHGV